MKRSLSAAAIALMLLLNPFSASRTNATTRCGQAPPQGRVAVRIGFQNAGETTRISHIRNTIQNTLGVRVELCDFMVGALPPIPLLQLPGDFTKAEADNWISEINRVVGGVRVYQSPDKAENDWVQRRFPRVGSEVWF